MVTSSSCEEENSEAKEALRFRFLTIQKAFEVYYGELHYGKGSLSDPQSFRNELMYLSLRTTTSEVEALKEAAALGDPDCSYDAIQAIGDYSHIKASQYGPGRQTTILRTIKESFPLLIRNLPKDLREEKKDSIRDIARNLLTNWKEADFPEGDEKPLNLFYVEIVAEVTDLSEEGILHRLKNHDYSDLKDLVMIMERGDGETAEKVFQSLQKGLAADQWRDYLRFLSPITKKINGSRKLSKIVPKALLKDTLFNEIIKKSPPIKESGKLHEMVGLELRRLGIDPSIFLPRWIDSCYAPPFPSHQNELIVRNIEAFKKLEGIKPGITAFLYKKYGIADFARYPIEMLVEQYNLRDDQTRDYMALFFPRADDEGSFYGEIDVLLCLFKQLKNFGYTARICESGSKAELLHRFNRLRKIHRKITDLMLSGHGSPRGFRVGRDATFMVGKGAIHIDDLMNSERAPTKVNQALSLAVEEGASVIFNSCFTGSSVGITNKTSEVNPGITTHGPSAPSIIKGIVVTKKPDGRLAYKVDFDDFHRAKSNTFFMGKLQKE